MANKQPDTSWLDNLRRQHGSHIVRSLSEITRFFSRRVSTTYAELDAALQGGLPRGQVVEFIGRNSNGMSTLMLRILAQEQQARQTVAYIDCPHTFDASYATRHGVNVESLILVRPQNGQMALSIADSLVEHNNCKLIIFDGLADVLAARDGVQQFEQGAYRLALSARRRQAIVIFLNRPEFRYILEHGAGVRLGFKKQRWLWHRNDIIGCQTRVTVMKNKGRPEQTGATVPIHFNPVSETDTTWWT